MSAKKLLYCIAFMLLAIVAGAFVGGFFWVPRDVDSYSRGMAQIEQSIANGVVLTKEDIQRTLGQDPASSEQDPPTGARMLWNSVQWRPWLILPFVFISLCMFRPNIGECTIGAAFVSAMLMLIDLNQGAFYLVISVFLYIAMATYRLWRKKGDLKRPKGDGGN